MVTDACKRKAARTAYNATNLIANRTMGICAMCQNEANIQNKGVKRTMSRQSIWATKVAALIQGGNSQAALAQIKVAPTVKDLQQLRSMLTTKGLLSKNRLVDEATADQIVALSAPRLHRSP